MRRVAGLAVMPLGLVVLAVAVTVLIQHGLSLPAPSVQTEGQWAAYRLHRWAFLMGGLPLGLGIFLAGYLLWPGRLVGDSLVRPLAVVGTLVALAASGMVGFVIWSSIQYSEPFLQAPWLAVQGGTLLGGLAVLGVLAVRKLVEQLPGVRAESPDKAEGKKQRGGGE